MIWSTLNFHSEALQQTVAVHLLTPTLKELKQSEAPLPVLYLLHGLHGNETDWMRYSALERYAQKYRLVVVMPGAGRSFYMDMLHGPAYGTYVSKELPELIESYYPVSKDREHRFIAGLSMGGYGAVRIALENPERYARCGTFSGALCLEERTDGEWGVDGSGLKKEVLDICGGEEGLLKAPCSLRALGDIALREKKPLPEIYQECGTEDFLYRANQLFLKYFKGRIPIEYHERPGAHTWEFWDIAICNFLETLPLEKAIV